MSSLLDHKPLCKLFPDHKPLIKQDDAYEGFYEYDFLDKYYGYRYSDPPWRYPAKVVPGHYFVTNVPTTHLEWEVTRLSEVVGDGVPWVELEAYDMGGKLMPNFSALYLPDGVDLDWDAWVATYPKNGREGQGEAPRALETYLEDHTENPQTIQKPSVYSRMFHFYSYPLIWLYYGARAYVASLKKYA